MDGYRLKIAAIDEHAHAIGYLCMRWAMLEQRMHACLNELGAFPDEKIGNCLMSGTNMTAKIAMLKGAAFEKKPSNKWFDAFCAVLNRVDKDMAGDLVDRHKGQGGRGRLRSRRPFEALADRGFQIF